MALRYLMEYEYGVRHEGGLTAKGQENFILLEASLRRVSRFVTKGRYPERDEIFRIALRLRALSVRMFMNREKSKKEFGIRTPRGLLPLF